MVKTTMLTNEQLKGMEVGAPLLVAEYRKLHDQLEFYQGRLKLANEDIAVWQKSDTDAIRRLCRDMLYTMCSGVVAHSAVTELMNRAKELQILKAP